MGSQTEVSNERLGKGEGTGNTATIESTQSSEPSLPGASQIAEADGSTTTGAIPQIAINMADARTLLSRWEDSTLQRQNEPLSVHASGEFFLPYLAANERYQSPHIVLWESGGTPTGILIARIAHARPARAIGPITIPMPRLKTLEIVHGGLEAENKDTANLQLEYIRDILASGEVDSVAIHHLPCESEAGKQLSAGLRFPGDGNPVFTSHWCSQLTDGDGNPVIHNSSKTRSSFRRKDRKLKAFFQDRVQVLELNTVLEVTPLIAAASSIGERSYQGGLGVGVRDNPHWQTVLTILAANKQLRGYLLQADGVNVAYGVGAACRGTFCYMAGSFLPEYRDIAPGGYLLRRIFEQLQDQGIRWFDFGFGDAPYKELHGNWHKEEATYHFYAKSRPAIAARMLDGLVQWSNRNLRKMLTTTGLLERARRLWRRRLERSERKSETPDKRE